MSTRINDLSMTKVDILQVMSDGGPGALIVMMHIFDDEGKIDPDNALGGLGHIMWLDNYGIYGARIWTLYKDVCNQNLTNMLGVIRGVQLGFLSINTLNRAIDVDRAVFDIDVLLTQVREKLPRFGASVEPPK